MPITDKDPRSSTPRRRDGIEAGRPGTAGGLRLEQELLQIARDILQSRRQRNQEFGKRLFSEPAWDMLLELYVRENAGLAATSRDLISASGAARSTAVRWMSHLETELLVARRPHPQDSAIHFIELTDLGRESLGNYLLAIRSGEI